jgi:hypothetical protein
VVISVRANLAFLAAHQDWYTAQEALHIRTCFANSLVDAHEIAFWTRKNDVARECRRLYYETHPQPEESPRLFDRRLYPRWLVCLKDWFDHAWGQSPGKQTSHSAA